MYGSVRWLPHWHGNSHAMTEMWGEVLMDDARYVVLIRDSGRHFYIPHDRVIQICIEPTKDA